MLLELFGFLWYAVVPVVRNGGALIFPTDVVARYSMGPESVGNILV